MALALLKPDTGYDSDKDYADVVATDKNALRNCIEILLQTDNRIERDMQKYLMPFIRNLSFVN